MLTLIQLQEGLPPLPEVAALLQQLKNLKHTGAVSLTTPAGMAVSGEAGFSEMKMKAFTLVADYDPVSMKVLFSGAAPIAQTPLHWVLHRLRESRVVLQVKAQLSLEENLRDRARYYPHELLLEAASRARRDGYLWDGTYTYVWADTLELADERLGRLCDGG